MTINKQGYPFNIGDSGWVITEGNIRSGVCAVVEGLVDGQLTYQFLMTDNKQLETYSQNQLYALLSYAQVAYQSMVTPTPSVTVTMSPTPSRTPAASPTQTMTPTPSPVIYPNLLFNPTWEQQLHGFVSTDTHGNTIFTSAETNPNEPVFFQTTITVTPSTNYNIFLRYIQGTCQFANVFVDALGSEDELSNLATFSLNISDPTAAAQTIINNSGTWNASFVTPSNCTQVKISVLMFGDPNFKTPAPSGYTFKFAPNCFLQKYVPYVAPSPTPSVTPSSAGGLSYDQTILSHTPVLAYWPFNSDFTDLSGNNNTLNIVGSGTGIIPTEDSYGNTIFFDTPNSGLTFTNTITVSNDYSLEAWVSFESFTIELEDADYFTIFGAGNTIGVLVDNTGAIYLSNTDDFISPTTTLSPQTVYHLVITVDSSGNVIFYVNGVPYTGNSTSIDTYNFNMLGSNVAGQYFYGIIGNPAIYVGVLTQAEVSANYNAGTHNYRYSSNIVMPTPTPTPSAPIAYSSSLIRLNSDTTWDSTYQTAFSEYQPIVYQTADGHIYVGTETASVDGNAVPNCYIRLNSDGTYDSTFLDSSVQGPLFGMAQTPNGNITATVNSSVYQFASDGVTINGDQLEYNVGSLNTIIPLVNNQTLLLGAFTNIGGENINYIARINADNTIDTTYTTTINNGSNTPRYCALASGKFLITGEFTQIDSTSVNGIARLNADGTFDNTFITTDTFSYGSQLVELDNGQLLTWDTTASLVRLNSDGTLDTTYVSINDFAWNAICKLPDNTILAATLNNIYHLDANGYLIKWLLPVTQQIQVITPAADGHIYISLT